jgi:hypothetical protein
VLLALGKGSAGSQKGNEKEKECYGWIDEKDSPYDHDRRECHCQCDSDSNTERRCAAETLMGFKDITEQELLLRKYTKWFPELQSRTPSPCQLAETRTPSPVSSSHELQEYMVKMGVYPKPSATPSRELDSLASPSSSIYAPEIVPTKEWPQSPTLTRELPRSPSTDLALSPLKEIPTPLDQIQYRSYKQPITLYHYNTLLLPIHNFCNRLTKPKYGYVHSLISHDAISDLAISDGDKTPELCVEAVYMPSVFRESSKGTGVGCAIGLRYQGEEGMQVEWLCFRGPGRELIEECRNERGELVCDRVGEVEKMCKQGCKGEGEHRDWWGSLEKGVVKEVRLRLVLREEGKGDDVYAQKEMNGGEMESVAKRRKIRDGDLRRGDWLTPPPERNK